MAHRAALRGVDVVSSFIRCRCSNHRRRIAITTTPEIAENSAFSTCRFYTRNFIYEKGAYYRNAVKGFAEKKEGYDKLPDEALAAVQKLVDALN